MAEDYAHACRRAELLGLPRPGEQEWSETRRRVAEPTEEEVEDSMAEDLETKDGSLGRVGGGLDELNGILSVTQRKLSRLKMACGSLGAMLHRVGAGSRASTPDHASLRPDPADDCRAGDPRDAPTPDGAVETAPPAERAGAGGRGARRRDIDEKVESHVDKLDLLIGKAENARYSMQHQSKRMRKLLK